MHKAMISTVICVLTAVAAASAAAAPVGFKSTGLSIDTVSQILKQPLTYTSTWFVGNISVGTPGQAFRVLIDTSSTDSWLMDPSCSGCPFDPELPSHANGFDSSFSSTYKRNGRPFRVEDAHDVTVTGLLGNDNFNVGGVSDGQLISAQQAFGLVTKMEKGEGPFANGAYADGLLGLAFPAISKNGLVSPIFGGINQGLLAKPIFTIWLQRNTKNGGQATYGGLDTENCGEVIAYQPLSSATFWQFRMRSIAVGGFSSTAGWDAVSDTLSDGIYVPVPIYEKIIDELAEKFLSFCDVTDPIILGIGQNTYAINPTHYISSTPPKMTSDFDQEGNTVALELYMEAQCPDTTRLVYEGVWPAWQKLSETGRIDLTVVPFGKATCLMVGDDFDCKCQHGPTECELNQLMNCVIEELEEPLRYMPIIYCIQGKSNVDHASVECLNGNPLAQKLMECGGGGQGRRLLYLAGQKTAAVQSPLSFVPTIVINGELSMDSVEDLMGSLCMKLSPQPSQCANYRHCTLALGQSSSAGFGPSVDLGAPFIEQYCNVYDIGQQRIGFAEARIA